MYATSDTEALLKMMASSDPEALPNYLRATLPELTANPRESFHAHHNQRPQESAPKPHPRDHAEEPLSDPGLHGGDTAPRSSPPGAIPHASDGTAAGPPRDTYKGPSAPPKPSASLAGKDLEAMSTFFVEQLRLKDPVKSALAFHDQGIMSLKSWASKTEEERTKVVHTLKLVGVVAGDRTKLRKVTLEQISEWTRSKSTPQLPSVLPHQRQSKEEMEAILGSGNNERLITEDLVGLGLRGIYGGSMDLFVRRLGNGGDGAATTGARKAVAAGDGAAAAVSEEDVTSELEVQANIYKMCVHREGERRVLNELLRLRAGDEATINRLKGRLEQLDRYEAMMNGSRCCLAPECKVVETTSRKFEICARCKIAAYCSRECQKADWKSHSKFCLPPPGDN
eukprot:m.328102 g.328102  ORF g.328102 m.328102 type:complete len:396 (+) comp27686_c0_seq6:112-1299(+)